MIFLGFRQLLGFFFSLFSFIPYINPMIIPEIFVTNLVGLIFLVGFQNVNKKFSTGRWLNLALKKINQIKSRKKIPILVGGTGLYFKSII